MVNKIDSMFPSYCDCDEKNICDKCGKPKRPKYQPKITC